MGTVFDSNHVHSPRMTKHFISLAGGLYKWGPSAIAFTKLALLGYSNLYYNNAAYDG